MSAERKPEGRTPPPLKEDGERWLAPRRHVTTHPTFKPLQWNACWRPGDPRVGSVDLHPWSGDGKRHIISEWSAGPKLCGAVPFIPAKGLLPSAPLYSSPCPEHGLPLTQAPPLSLFHPLGPTSPPPPPKLTCGWTPSRGSIRSPPTPPRPSLRSQAAHPRAGSRAGIRGDPHNLKLSLLLPSSLSCPSHTLTHASCSFCLSYTHTPPYFYPLH